jgi:S1-C subfamily serine protease
MNGHPNKTLLNICRAAAIALPLLPAIAAGQSPAAKDVPTIAREASPAVVRIVIRDRSGQELGSGSGFVASGDGRIVTNYHVIHVSGAAQAEARFTDGAAYQVQGVLAMNPDADLAILKLQAAREFPLLRLGDSDRVETGDRVVAIGNPLGGISPLSTEATVSDGIISGIRDWPEHGMKVFQITAPISPGSSGGALLNLNGEAIGVTFAQLVAGQNLNFAIPITYVRPLLEGGATKSLAEINLPPPDDGPRPEIAPTGSYTGMWQSGKFSASGAASMTIRITGNVASAEIFLTGGEVTSATLSGMADRTGENIWTVELTSKHPKLSVRGIFRSNSFVGDYTYSRFLMFDQGQWTLKKE